MKLPNHYTHKEEFAERAMPLSLWMGVNTSKSTITETSHCDVSMGYGSSLLSQTNSSQAGHELPYYQPEARLEMFRRVILGIDSTGGNLRFDGNYSSTGSAHAIHRESFVALPYGTSLAAAPSFSATTAGGSRIMSWYSRESVRNEGEHCLMAKSRSISSRDIFAGNTMQQLLDQNLEPHGYTLAYCKPPSAVEDSELHKRRLLIKF